MVSLLGTIRRNLRPDNWSDERRGNSGFLTSFVAGPGDNVYDGHRTISKKSSRRCPERQGTIRNGFHKNHPTNTCLDQNRNALARLPNFNEKKIFLPVMSDRMTRTNLSLEGLQKQTQSIYSDASLTSYRFIKVLGKGTFAKVKLAEHMPTGHKVAIKVIDKNRLTEADLRKIQREIQIMKCLNHPNIIRLYEVIEDNNMINIVMEYAAKGEIYDYIIHKKRLTEDDARSKFRQLLSAIAYCHSKDIVHRDLKVENLLLDKDNNVKVCDFGFGNFFDRDNKLDTFCGSPPYAAPELFRGDKYIGPEVDVWSLGVILFTFFTGSLPFNGKTLPALKSDVLKGNFTVPNYVRVGSELFLRKFLRVAPEERISLEQAMVDPWMTYGYVVGPLRKCYSLENPINMAVFDEMIRMGYQEGDIYESLEKRLFDDLHVTYRILCVHNEETSFFESFKNSNNNNNNSNNNKGAQFKSEMTLAQGIDTDRANAFDSPHHIKTGQISSSNHHYHHDHHDTNNFRVMTPKTPPKGLRHVADIHRRPTYIGTEQQERFIRRYSIGVQPDLIVNMDANKPEQKHAKVSRISSLRVKLSPDVTYKKENVEEQTPKVQKSFKKLSRNIFKRTKNVDLADKEEVGIFARLPSMSLRNEQSSCNSTSDGNSNLAIDKSIAVPPTSNAVSHHLTLDIRDNQKNAESFRKTSSNQSLTYPYFNQIQAEKFQGPTLKEKFIELFRIKRN